MSKDNASSRNFTIETHTVGDETISVEYYYPEWEECKTEIIPKNSFERYVKENDLLEVTVNINTDDEMDITMPMEDFYTEREMMTKALHDYLSVKVLYNSEFNITTALKTIFDTFKS